MSFSRAPLKRFNENIGCAPAPGTYELKPGEVKGPASFHRSERFKQTKVTAPVFPASSSSKDVPMSPVRRTLSVDGLVEGSMSKKDRSDLSMQTRQHKLLEKEIRSLVHQRGEQDKRLVVLEEELRKVEYKLLSTVREKTGLAASVTTLERQLAEVKKTNEFLKNKVSADTIKKRIQSLSMELMDASNKLDTKEKELSFLQISTEGQVKLLEVDLEAARATLTALRERNMDLEDLHRDTKVQNEELENEMDTLQAVIQGLREEVRILQGYLDTANDQNQDLRVKIREQSEKSRMSESELEKQGHLQQKLEQCTTELHTSQNSLRLKEEECEKCQQDLLSSQDALRETEKHLQRLEAELTSSMTAQGEMEVQMQRTNQELSDSQSAVFQRESELAGLREVLRRTEEELDMKVARLDERCKIVEEERDKSHEKSQRRIEELTAELSLLQETRKSEGAAQEQLQQARTSLIEELEREKERSASIASLLGRVREETEQERRLLEDELEEALEELSVLELQEERRAEEETRRQEVLRSLQQEKTNMERELAETRALVDGRSSDVVALEELHSAAMRRLQEEYTTSLSKIGEMATELESMRLASKGAEERRKQLEEEMERVTKQMKKEIDRVSFQKEEEGMRVRLEVEEERGKCLASQQAEEKAREEYARMLLEVQTRLAQRDEEINRAKEDAQSRLQKEIMEKEEVQRLIKQAGEEKEKVQRLLGQEREAREADRRDLLKNLLDESDQQRVCLQSQVDLMEKEKATLQSQLDTAAQEKVTLQWEMEEQRRDFQRQLAETQDNSARDAEAQHWRRQYEELYSKVKPFQEQLNGFAAERDALLNENGANQEELTRLADAYARLLGHQNQKQKIRHVVKLKDENVALKQELSKLRVQVSRQKKDVEQLKGGQRKFDPSEAFKHQDGKENENPAASTLRQGNRC
ncbi:hypothetical protein DPEC_G00020790 [Dallia pectoralis]|uniref:Uncharacterized protein n=1 Tax=Dallia pectoralis TaxID=75939 RepID=A0ACC2HFY4_DALPE|nr:hypothetical protein DPEC_G00020790 [Dallia pectoralis]